ncbi:9345_t:CDS:2, partial [Dentiscutata erythropus]
CDVKSNKPSMVWRPLLPNLRCIQVPLTEVPSVLDLYTFDTTSPGGSRLGEGYKILPENCTNKYQVHEGDVKTITLVDEHAKQLYESIFAYVEYLGCSARRQ